MYIYQCIKNKTQHNKNHNTRYNVVHPQCRGYVHRTVFYSTFYKNHSSDLRTQLQIPSSPQSRTHSCRPLRTQLQISLITKNPLHTQLQRSSTHTAGTLTFLTKIALASHLFHLHQKPKLTSLQECLFIQRTITKPWT